MTTYITEEVQINMKQAGMSRFTALNRSRVGSSAGAGGPAKQQGRGNVASRCSPSLSVKAERGQRGWVAPRCID